MLIICILVRVGKVPFLYRIFRYRYTIFVYQLQIHDTLRERNESVPILNTRTGYVALHCFYTTQHRGQSHLVDQTRQNRGVNESP